MADLRPIPVPSNYSDDADVPTVLDAMADAIGDNEADLNTELGGKENTSNKKTTLSDSNDYYPTTGAVKTVTDALDSRVELLENIESMETLSWQQIQAIVQSGKASTYFKVGDQIETKWKDKATNTEYTIPLDVVAIRDVTILDDNQQEQTVHGMIVQWHYCSPFGVQFSQNEAFYYCNEELPVGTYYFTIGANWGTNCHNNYKYQFTTTQVVPAGGQLQIGKSNSEVSGMPDNAPSTWRVRTYASASDTTPLEILSLTEYTTGTPSGTSLGTLNTTSKYNTTLNNLYSSAYGQNSWKNSALRQFLNSDAGTNGWYTLPSDDVFARKPAELSSKQGFLTGVDSELLAVIKPIKVATAINTNRDSERGTWDYTYDKFFIPSLEEAYCVPQISGEGAYWPYWKQKSGTNAPNEQNSTNANLITYGADNHASAQTVRLRSAGRGVSYYTWNVNSSGKVINYYATNSYRFSPACVIC